MKERPIHWDRAEILRSSLLVGIALVAGFSLNQLAWMLLFAALIWMMLHFREFLRFARWAAQPLRRPWNKTSVWAQPTEHLFRALKNSRQRSHHLITELQRFQHTYNAIPDGAVIVDEKGRIERLNAAARKLLGINRFDEGQNLVSLVRDPDLVSLVDGRVDSNIIELALAVDQGRHLEIRRIFIRDDRWLILVRDVTELNRLLTMRQDFIANVSHEIRTPLTIIMGYLETLSEGEVSNKDEMLTILSRMMPPALRMKALVEDLSLLTRLESSPAPAITELDRLDVRAILTELVSQAERLSQTQHNIRLSAEPLGLFGLETELHSAFSNLIANAVRYSPEGGDIDVRWFATTTGARFEVQDQGIGIAPEHLSRLTERFYRVDFARARVKGGTGLGLAIVKHVLKRHNAVLEIKSELGKGSLFACEFALSQIADHPRIQPPGSIE